MQLEIFREHSVKPFTSQLLKWVGNKQRYAHEIIGYFPENIKTYYEPFLGSGAVLGTLDHEDSVGSDIFEPLIDIWQTLKDNPDELNEWYRERWKKFMSGDRVSNYEEIKKSYNSSPNGADLLFLSRSCYGGVVRFRKDGYMSTPCGIHTPISPESFSKRVQEWGRRTRGTTFICCSYKDIMKKARKGDLIYCDPPYIHSQAILYGGQMFKIDELLNEIYECKNKGVYVALSIDGTKKSGNNVCHVPMPTGLFERQVYVNCGRSMLKRFQMEGLSLEGEVVFDRLLLTY